MNTVKPRRIHLVWDAAVLIVIAALTAGACLMLEAGLAVWIIAAEAAVGALSLIILCGRFTSAQGRDIFILTEDAVPKGKIAGRFILEFCIVILLAAAAGAGFWQYGMPLLGFEVSGTEKPEESAMDFRGFTGSEEMPDGFDFQGMGEGNRGSFSSDFSFDESTAGEADSFPSRPDGESGEADSFPDRSDGRDKPDVQTGGDGEENGNYGGRQTMQRLQGFDMTQIPADDQTETETDTGSAFPYIDLLLITVLYLWTVSLTLVVNVRRYRPCDEYEWKYEYDD